MQIGTHLRSARERVQFEPFWKVTNFGLSFWPLHYIFNAFDEFGWAPLKLVYKGADEWGNPSLLITIPLIGRLILFYGRDFDRSSWFLSSSVGDIALYVSPDWAYEARIRYDGDFDTLVETKPRLTEEEIQATAHAIESVED